MSTTPPHWKRGKPQKVRTYFAVESRVASNTFTDVAVDFIVTVAVDARVRGALVDIWVTISLHIHVINVVSNVHKIVSKQYCIRHANTFSDILLCCTELKPETTVGVLIK